MELTSVADCGAAGGDDKSERVEEEVASGDSVRVERFVRPPALMMPPNSDGVFESLCLT